jgi:hypothetical protein
LILRCDELLSIFAFNFNLRRYIKAEPRLVERAQASAAALREAVLSGRVPGFTTDADAGSPVVPLRLAAAGGAGDEVALLAEVAARARRRGIGVCVARVNPLVPAQHRPPLVGRSRLTLSSPR